jgi:hypothetical protein
MAFVIGNDPTNRTTFTFVRSAPRGYDWGFVWPGEPRMHLQTVDAGHLGEYRVWLEEGGRRAFVPAGPIPPSVLAAIRDRVARNRRSVEYFWSILATREGWIRASRAGDLVTVEIYPGTPGHFSRTVDLATEFPFVAARDAVPFLDDDDASLVLYESPRCNRIDLALPGWLWGSEAI